MKTTLEQMLFPVVMELTSDMSKVRSISSTEYGIYGYVDGKGSEPTLLNTCSKGYELLPCDQIFPRIEKMLVDAGIEFEVTYRMIDFSRFYADYNLKTGGVSVGNRKDKIFPILRIEHSYNGLLKYKMTFGWFRMICTNGLTIPVEGKEEQNISIVGKHTKKILESLDQLLEKVQFFTKNQKKYTQKYEIMADRWVEKWADRIEECMAVSGVGKRGLAQITDRIKLESKELYDGEVNDWLIYNAFNYHIYNAVTSEGKEYATAPNLRHDQDKKVFQTLFNYEGKALTKEAKKKAKEVVEA
jgi:hypothetical protein